MIKVKLADLTIGIKCPAATQDLELNTKNRNNAIQADYIQYGPLNVDEPGDYWEKIADHWDTTEEAAKKSLCGNCTAFDISPRMKECMPGETSDEDGELGYCHMHKFKCHSARSCYTWAKGGPIEDDDISIDWQTKGEEEQLDEKREKRKKKKKSSGKKDACYYKVKSRYSVFPSAYASGALVKCRKVGAKNWGNSKKNESIEEALDPQEKKELRTIKMQLNKSAAKHARQAKQATDIAQASEKSSNLHAKQVKTIDKMLGEELIPGGLGSELTGDVEHQHKKIADMHNISVEDVEKQIQKGIEVEMEHTSDPEYAHEIAMDHVIEDPNYYDKLVKLKLEAKRKLTSKPSSETNLRDWFKRKGSPGKTGGWVDCNTCRNGKCKPCGRQEGEKRAKYPACRPTPAACKESGRSKTWGKKSAKGKK